MARHKFTHLASGRCARFHCCSDAAHVAADDRGYEAGTDSHTFHNLNIRSFGHGVGRFHQRNQALRFNESNCVIHDVSLYS